jgi:hypothetical protein
MPGAPANSAHKSAVRTAIIAVIIGLALIAGVLGLFRRFAGAYMFPGPTEVISEYPSYQSSFPSPDYDYLPTAIPTTATDAAVQLHPGALQAPTTIQLRLVWPDQATFDSELQRLETLEKSPAIRTAQSPDEAFMLMAQPHHDTPNLKWITNLPQWLAADPARRVMLMHFGSDIEKCGAVAICPNSQTVFYCAQFQ